MTNQLQGEILFKGWAGDGTATNWAYTPWMPVRGDKATFGVEILEISSSTDLKWNVQTRKLEDPGPSGELFTTQTDDTVGVHVVEASGLTSDAKQLVRYMFSVPGTASTSDRVHFRALAPSWQEDR